MYILYIFYIYFIYILCIFYVYFIYILYIFYVYFIYILYIFYVYFIYILCIFYILFIISESRRSSKSCLFFLIYYFPLNFACCCLWYKVDHFHSLFKSISNFTFLAKFLTFFFIFLLADQSSAVVKHTEVAQIVCSIIEQFTGERLNVSLNPPYLNFIRQFCTLCYLPVFSYYSPQYWKMRQLLITKRLPTPFLSRYLIHLYAHLLLLL